MSGSRTPTTLNAVLVRKLAAFALGGCAIALLVALPSAARLSITPGLLGNPPPDCGAVGKDYADPTCTTQTRNGTFHLSTHIVRAGETITGTIGNRCMKHSNGDFSKPPDQECPIDWSGLTGSLTANGKRVSGCKPTSATCTIRIPKNAQSTSYTIITVGITSDQGTGISKDYFAVIGKNSAVIEGTIRNKNRDAVAGVEVRIYGSAGNYIATSGSDGGYAMEVKAGNYRLFPSAASLGKTPPKFEPAQTDRNVEAGHKATADFTIDVSLVVKLTLSDKSVNADGFQIVKGTIEVTEFGRPKPGVVVALWPKANEHPNKAVTSGALANVCGPSGRIWPGGTLADPQGESVDVTMDSSGKYQFTLDVGTAPGAFTVTAWARDSDGSLITHDTLDATDEQTLTVEPLRPAHSLESFIDNYKELATSPFAAKITADPTNIATTLGLAAGAAPPMRGYAFAVANGTSKGAAVIIYSATNPPNIAKSGNVVGDAHDLVLQPGEWSPVTGAAVTDLGSALQKGQLQDLPTFSAWARGATVSNWSGSPQAMQLASQSFQYYGWPYPSSTPGACS